MKDTKNKVQTLSTDRNTDLIKQVTAEHKAKDSLEIIALRVIIN